MPWTWYRPDGSVKGQGTQGTQGIQGPAVYVDMEGPEGPESWYPIVGPQGPQGQVGPQGPLPYDPDPPDEPILLPGPVGGLGGSITTSAVADAASPGADTNFASRQDHRHGREAFATPVRTTPTLASAQGVATTVPQSDHAHRSPGGVAALTSAFTLANSTTETQALVFSIPANFMAAGTTFLLSGFGVVSTVAATGGTVTWRVRIGSTTLTGNIATSLAPATAAGITTIAFELMVLVTVRTAGASGTVIGNGSSSGNVGTAGALVYTGSGTTATVAVDTTAAKLVELTAQWSAANASNTVTLHNASIEVVVM
jgi:hypothetical protein